MGRSADSSQRGTTQSALITDSLSELAHELLNPKVLFRVGGIQERSLRVDAKPGLYGWWFSSQLRGVPVEDTQLKDGWHLLYIGIAPSRPTLARRPSTLINRLKTHCRGPIASSTLRRTLVCLLGDRLKLDVKRRPSGKFWMGPEDERRLTKWMDQNARVAWFCCDRPWQLEAALIGQGSPRLPLNIRGSRDPFAAVLKRLRAEVGRCQKGRGMR
jgi:hypothetical protein